MNAPEKKTRARAVVSVEVEVYLAAAWGGDCPLSQVHDQAGREGLDRLRHVLEAHRDIQIKSGPHVQVVIHEVER